MSKDLPDPRAQLEQLGPKGRRVLRVLRVYRARQALRALKALQGPQDRPVRRERRATKVRRDSVEQQAIKVRLVIQAIQEHKASREHLDL